MRDAGEAITDRQDDGNSPISIVTSGAFAIPLGRDAREIRASTVDGNSPISIVNSGAFTGTAVRDATGIDAYTHNLNSPISIVNSGDFWLTAGRNATASGLLRLMATARSAS